MGTSALINKREILWIKLLETHRTTHRTIVRCSPDGNGSGDLPGQPRLRQLVSAFTHGESNRDG